MGTPIATIGLMRNFVAMLKLNSNVLSLVSVETTSKMAFHVIIEYDQESVLPVSSCAMVSTTVVTQVTNCWLPAVLFKEQVALNTNKKDSQKN